LQNWWLKRLNIKFRIIIKWVSRLCSIINHPHNLISAFWKDWSKILPPTMRNYSSRKGVRPSRSLSC